MTTVGLSVGLTIIFYVKTIFTIRNYPHQLRHALKKSTKTLTYYPIIQIIIMGPYIIYLALHLREEVSNLISFIPEITIACTGLVNTSLYLSQMKHLVLEEEDQYMNISKQALIE